jgi:hypothetical protein
MFDLITLSNDKLNRRSIVWPTATACRSIRPSNSGLGLRAVTRQNGPGERAGAIAASETIRRFSFSAAVLACSAPARAAARDLPARASSSERSMALALAAPSAWPPAGWCRSTRCWFRLAPADGLARTPLLRPPLGTPRLRSNPRPHCCRAHWDRMRRHAGKDLPGHGSCSQT